MKPSQSDPQESWHPARLIPVAGIRGQEEQEARATSAFLAVMRAVPDLAYGLLVELGAPRGKVETFTEVRLKGADGVIGRPDGVVVVSRGSRVWRALVEVKTGSGVLTTEQTNRYLDIARDHGFDCVITISNEITAKPTDVPVSFDRRKTKRVGLYHLSWWRVVTTAIMQHRFRGVSDPDQAWILGELIAYLDHENSGASGFQGMGAQWVEARDAARQGTLRANDPAARDVVEHWEQFLDYLALGLSQDLGRDVEPVRSRKQSLAERVDAQVKKLAADGQLAGAVRVPDAIGSISVTVDLRTRQVTTAVDVPAPRDGSRQPTRINWLLRQLADAPASLRVSASFANVRETSSVLLSDAREDPGKLLSGGDPRRDIRSFELAATRPLGMKNGKSKGSFIADTRQQAIDFYAEVVQNVSAWQPKAPRLPEPPAKVPVTPQEDPPPFVVASEREVGEGQLPSGDGDVTETVAAGAMEPVHPDSSSGDDDREGT